MSDPILDYFEQSGSRMLAGWHADASLIQLDRLTLRIATPWCDCLGPVLQEVRGTVVRDSKRGQHVLFDNRNLVRIIDGPRRGLISRAAALRPDESGKPAGWFGRKAQNSGHYQKIHEWFAERLAARKDAETMPAPELLVSCQDCSSLHARLTGKTVQFLKLREGEAPDDALKRRWEELSIPHEDRPGYRLLPLRHVTGRGGVYAKLLVRVSDELNNQLFSFKGQAPEKGTLLTSAEDELCQIEVLR